MTTGKALNGKPYAGNPHVRFDEGEVASAATPRRGSLLYRTIAVFAGLALSSVSFAEVLFRQPVSDMSFGITRDFSELTIAPQGYREQYNLGLLESFNQRIGRYEYVLPNGLGIAEWRSAKRLEMVIDKEANVSLLIVSGNGKKSLAPRSDNGFLSDSSIFLGPKDEGLLFLYGIHSNTIYTLFSPNQLQLPMVFKKIGTMPLAKKLPKGKDYALMIGSDKNNVDGELSRDKRKKMAGWYRLLEPQKRLDDLKTKALFLVVHQDTDETTILFYKGGHFVYDQGYNELCSMDIRRGPYGSYRVTEARLDFCLCPNFNEDLLTLQKYVAKWRMDDKGMSRLKSLHAEHDFCVTKYISEYWKEAATNSLRTSFLRVQPFRISADDLIVARDGMPVYTSSEYRREILKHIYSDERR